MLLKLRQFLTLARLTALEALRQPICLLLTVTCVVLTALIPLLQLHDFGEEGRLERDGGFALHVVFGLLVAVYAACTSLSREVRRGTAAAVLSKPVGRDLFFLSKFAGLVAVVAAFSLCAVVATLLGERAAIKFVMTPALVGYVEDTQTGLLLLAAPAVALLAAGLLNYTSRRPFQSTAFWFLLLALLAALVASGFFDRTGRLAAYDLRVQWRILPASLLLTTAVTALAALALSCSTRLNTAPTLTVCGLVFLGGLLSDHVLGRHAGSSAVASFLYAIVPNWQHFWLADALADGGTIPWSYVGRAMLYAGAYTTAVLAAGVLAFRRTDVV